MDRYIVYPTHDYEHHLIDNKKGQCTLIKKVKSHETVVLRTIEETPKGDDGCEIEVDGWQLEIWLDIDPYDIPSAYDVWLTTEGKGNICEHKGERDIPAFNFRACESENCLEYWIKCPDSD